MDFIQKLPMSNSSDMILVIIDHLTKQLIFILTVDTITSPMLAKLFILHVFSKQAVHPPCLLQAMASPRM